MQPWDIVLIALTAIAVHRLWIHEDIFGWPRRWCAKLPYPLHKPLTCPPCFAFWAGVLACGLRLFDRQYADDLWIGTTEVIAIYPVVRAYMALPALFGRRDRAAGEGNMNPRLRTKALDAVRGRREQQADARVLEEMQDIIADIDQEEPSGLEKQPCKTCADEKKLVKERLEALQGPLLVIASPLHAMIDSYSLCTAIMAQARAGVAEGFTVMLLVQQNFDIRTLPRDWDGNPHYILVPMLPVFEWQEDVLNADMATQITKDLRGFLAHHERGMLITHDMLFQSWYLTHAQALHDLGEVPGWQILHTLHSMPSKPEDLAQDDPRHARCSLPKGHKLLCLSHSAAASVADAYRTTQDNVLVLPNAFDVPDWYGATRKARLLVEENGLLTADVVQTYPISMPRMGSKGLLDLMWIFAAMKKAGAVVRLVIADAHGTEELRAEVKTAALAMGLGDEVILATDYLGDRDLGVGRSDLRVLMQLSNLFIFPSRSEACPLTLMEAAWAGNLLVLNSSLPVLRDLVGSAGILWYAFGSTTQAVRELDADEVARNILAALQAEGRNRVRKTLLNHTGIPQIGALLRDIHQRVVGHKSLARRVNGGSLEEPSA